jgi:hypothetical protein
LRFRWIRRLRSATRRTRLEDDNGNPIVGDGDEHKPPSAGPEPNRFQAYLRARKRGDAHAHHAQGGRTLCDTIVIMCHRARGATARRAAPPRAAAGGAARRPGLAISQQKDYPARMRNSIVGVQPPRPYLQPRFIGPGSLLVLGRGNGAVIQSRPVAAAPWRPLLLQQPRRLAHTPLCLLPTS